jgi:hypothetical protein
VEGLQTREELSLRLVVNFTPRVKLAPGGKLNPRADIFLLSSVCTSGTKSPINQNGRQCVGINIVPPLPNLWP